MLNALDWVGRATWRPSAASPLPEPAQARLKELFSKVDSVSGQVR